ncbi:MAG: MBL fold metallo-hydrolase [Anaerolineae bacterium]|nr:MAG: MBL fold metallo-hydrolase [Anaerolineae bacterium]WKZ45409.1 MAG: MBL fold metallo-hydrolase [Anaerolineales bacterium]
MADYFIEPFVDTGLGNSAYLIGSHETKKGILIDPLRDADVYLSAARKFNLTLTHVLDTHLHADFISGNREIAQQTGAVIGASAEARVGFDHQPLDEASVIDLGAFQIRVITTPGHSPEHISFLLVEPDGKTPSALFSGGALIVGGAARTDLMGHEHTHALAHDLYHTIHDKLLKLPDEVNVFPTHGAGSFCVAPVSSERTSTIGHERRTNALALAKNEDEFIKRSLTGLPLYPTYYKYMRELNQRGARILGAVPVLKPLSPSEVKSLMDDGAVVLDVRHQKAFAAGHIPNSFGIRVDAPLVVWAGWVIPFGSRIILLGANPDEIEEATRGLIRIGYDDVVGYVEGGIEAWAREYPVETIQSWSSKELRERLNEVTLVDVRRLSEWESGHIAGAIHFEGGRIPWEELPFPMDKPLAIQCASGNRSMVAISVLKRRGFHNVIQVDGGINKWKMNGFETVRDVSPLIKL